MSGGGKSLGQPHRPGSWRELLGHRRPQQQAGRVLLQRIWGQMCGVGCMSKNWVRLLGGLFWPEFWPRLALGHEGYGLRDYRTEAMVAGLCKGHGAGMAHCDDGWDDRNVAQSFGWHTLTSSQLHCSLSQNRAMPAEGSEALRTVALVPVQQWAQFPRGAPRLWPSST